MSILKVKISDQSSFVVVDFLLNNTKVDVSPPYFVTPPTPPDGSYFPVIVGSPQNWTIVAAINSSIIAVLITSSSLPIGKCGITAVQ